MALDTTAHGIGAAALAAQRGVEPGLALDADGQLAQVRFLGGAGWGGVGALGGTLTRPAVEDRLLDCVNITCVRDVAADGAIAQR
jgi:hypothetical protein